MIRYELHVPTQYNDGAPVGDVVVAEIEGMLLDVADGFTRTTALGAWRSPEDGVYHDPQYVYAIDSDEPIGERLRIIAARVARALSQEAVYMTARPIAAWLVKPTEEG